MVFLLNSLWLTGAFPSTADQESQKINVGRGQALVATAKCRAAALGPPAAQSCRAGSPTCHCRWGPLLPVSPSCLSAGWGLPGSCDPGCPRGQSLLRSGLLREQLQGGQEQQDLENKRSTSGNQRSPAKVCQQTEVQGQQWVWKSWHCVPLVSSSPIPTKLWH